MKMHVVTILVLLALFFGSVQPLLNDAYFPMHDDTQIGRVVAMGKALRAGQFPVRWVNDLGYGYGYPLFNFYAPLPYYIGGAFYALGFSGLIATKIMMGIGMVAAGISMYVLIVRFWGVAAATVAGLLYVYAPYHAVQLYVRGAVGELWTLVFLPLMAWGMLQGYANAKQSSWAVIAGLGLAGIILSHTLLGYATVVLFTICSFVFWIIRPAQRRYTALLSLKTLFVGLGVSAFFWLPALVEMRFTNVTGQIGASANFQDHFVCLSQLWSSAWGFAGSAAGCIDGMSFMLGKLHIALGAFAGVLFVFRKNSVHAHIIVAAGIITTLSIFFMLPISEVLWKSIPGFSYLQYPWRFLVFAMFGLSVLGAGVVAFVRFGFFRWSIALVIGMCVWWLYGKWFVPQYLFVKPAHSFETMEELRFRVSKISDEYMPPGFVSSKKEGDFVRDTIANTPNRQVATIVETETYSRFDIVTIEDETIQISKAYFPGMTVVVNGVRQTPKIEQGIISVDVPAGAHVVEVRLTNTPVRTIANFFSILVVLVLIRMYGKKANA
jgi:hypothetical protein